MLSAAKQALTEVAVELKQAEEVGHWRIQTWTFGGELGGLGGGRSETFVGSGVM